MIRTVLWMLTAAFGLLAAAGSAEAAPARYPFSIPAESYDAALIDFAIQANISIGGGNDCPGRSGGLRGRYTIKEGLAKLLAGSQCRFQVLEPGLVKVHRERPAPPSATTVPARTQTPSTAASIPSTLVGEVLVTANRRVASSEKIAADVSVLSGDQLTTAGVADIVGAADQIAGVSMTNLGPGRDKILLRGLSDGSFTGRTTSTVGTYLDDIPINYDAPDPDLRLTDVEGIEVVRGPQSALYGSGALSGLYRIVTNKPQPDGYHASLDVLGAWTSGGAPSSAIDGMVNVPLADGRSAFRLVGYGEVQGGYLNDVNLRKANVDQTVRNGGRFAVATALNESWSVTASGALQTLHSADTQYTTSMSSRNRANLVREDHKNDFAEGALTITGGGDWGRFSSYTGYIHHSYASRYDASNALTIFGGNDRELGIYDEASHLDMAVEDAVYTSPADERLQWLTGAFLSSAVERTPATLVQRFRLSGGVPQLLYDKHRRDRLIQAAIYGEASYRVGGGWTLTTGARVFDYGLSTAANVTTALPNGDRSFTGSQNFSGWAPRVSLQHDVAGRGIVYVLYSEGYREGGFNTGGLAPPLQTRQTYSPDRLQNLEVGAKLRFLDDRLQVHATGFFDRWLDIQTDEYLRSGLSFTANIGNGRNMGVEAELAYLAAPGLTFKANALIDQPSVTPFDSTARLSGLPGVPDASFGSLIVYERPLPRDLTLVLTGEAGYVGRSRLTFDPALSPVMGGYVTSELSAQLKSRRWRVALYLSNPTNESGDTFAFGNPFTFGQVRQVTPLRPRTLGLQLSAGF